MKFKKTFIMFLLSIFLLNISLIYATSNNNNNVVRIHIVANSDSIDDQLLKYTVARDIEKQVQELTKNSKSKAESLYILEQNIQEILNMCNNIIIQNNYTYHIKARLGKIKYDEKRKDNICMEAGTYDSLKIIIGDGNGQNWWSLIYPTTFQEIENEDVFSDETTFSFGIIDCIKKMFTKLSIS